MQEPYTIENTLAKEATGGSSALAATMLDQYWFERQQREGQYADRMANQMAFGQQQLHAQLLDQNMKNMTEAAKVPGALQMFASSPQYAQPFAGMDPSAVQQTGDIAAQTAQSQILKNTGQGAQGFAAGGYGLPITGLQTATGMQGITPQMPTAVAAQAEANKGRLGAAAIRAAGGGGGGGTVSTTEAPDPALGGMQVHRTLPKGSGNWTDQQVRDYLTARGAGAPAQVANPNAAGAQNQAPPPVRQGQTNLPPMAKTDTPANAPAAAPAKPTTTGAGPPGTVINKSDPRAQAVQAQINSQITNNKNMSAADRTNLGNAQLRVGTDNRVHVHGADGKDYGALPNG
jgi:hypothetical protein